MKLVMFETGGPAKAGVLIGEEHVLDIAAALPLAGNETPRFDTVRGLIEAGDRAVDAVRAVAMAAPEEALVRLEGVRLLPPIQPTRLRDTLMFLEHLENGLDKWARNLAAKEAEPAAAYARLKESGRYDLHPVFRQQVIYYNANHLGISGPGDDIVWPAHSAYADFELEFACIIGKPVRNADEAEAAGAIFGYTIYNDWSARDLQLDFMQANLGPAGGKDLAGGNTLGPCIVTADEIPDPYRLRMTARVNGETWTLGSTASIHHSFAKAIAQFSRMEALLPGEVIGSGTVLNGCGFEQGRQLADGDLVELEVEGIGILRNRVVFAR